MMDALRKIEIAQCLLIGFLIGLYGCHLAYKLTDYLNNKISNGYIYSYSKYDKDIDMVNKRIEKFKNDNSTPVDGLDYIKEMYKNNDSKEK